MTETANDTRFTPRQATLVAAGIMAIGVIILFAPIVAGRFVGTAMSDQLWAGIPFRDFWAEEFHRTGHIPLWNPYIFGGMPFVGAMHGDIFYPTSFLRLFLRADTVLGIVFALHLYLAGLFTYAFLRTLGLSWTASVVGGIGYQLTGIVVSLVSPGHDGKIVVESLLPMLLTSLVIGIRHRRLEGFGLTALIVGLDLLSPQAQCSQYSLIFAGFLALYLCFVDEQRPETVPQRWTALGLAGLAVVLGFGVAMIQYVPFIKYSPYGARFIGAGNWEYATAYAMPPANIVDWFTATFTGSTVWGTYWVGELVKLHSEYLGAAVVVLAALGIAKPADRKFAWFLGGVWLFFLLICLGAHTPFYRIWYTVMPTVKSTRAPGMAFFIPAFVVCYFAARGVERLERGEKSVVTIFAFAGAGILLLLGLSGAMTTIAENAAGESATAVRGEAGIISAGAALAGLFGLLATFIAVAAARGRIRGAALAAALCAVAGTDLMINAKRYYQYFPPAPQLYAPDSVVKHIMDTPKPYRVFDFMFTQSGPSYPQNFLMYERIPQVLGYHGNEMHAYDQLMGGKNVWRNMTSLRLYPLLGVRYVIFPVNVAVPGYHIVARTSQPAATELGRVNPEVDLYEADSIPPYARVVPGAVKVPDSTAVATLLDPRLDFNRLVLLSPDAPISPPSVATMPPALASRASVTHWEPGKMNIHLDPVPEQDAWLVVAENWYPDWNATVDGRPVKPVRGQGSLIALPVPKGAKDVALWFSSPAYAKGKGITLASLALIAVWIVVPPVRRRRRG